MNVLEKILEEIERLEDPYYEDYVDRKYVEEIIRSHMGGATDTEEKIREHIAECLHRIDNIRSFIKSKEYTNNDEKCTRNIEVLKTNITALEEYLSLKKKNSNDDWIPVENRLPNEREFQEAYCRNHYAAEFLVTIEGATKPTTLYFKNNSWFDEERNYYKVIAWRPLPEPYRPKEQNNGK